jgi:hypothetical protein
MRIEVRGARVTVEPSRRRRTSISLTLHLTDGSVQTTATVHADVYVGVADMFRDVKQRIRPTIPPHVRAVAFA